MNIIIKTMALAGMAAMAVSCGSGKKADEAAAAAAEERAILVTTYTAAKQDVPQTEVYSSTVQAFAVNNIAPQTAGRITDIKVDVGNFVTVGQLLATMDDSNLEQTRLKLINDSTELSRLESLYKEGGVSKSDYDASEMAYKVSKRSYENLVENTYLISPINGVVTERNYDEGDLYSGQAIYVVQQITPVKLLVSVSEADYSNVHKGDEVEITADALPGRTFTGRVNKIYPVIDAATHTFTTEILVQNGDRALRPGMFARVKLEFGVNNSVVIPETSIVKMQGSGQRNVFILQSDGTVKYSPVTVGRHVENGYEILSGVNEGDVVTVKGSTSLKDGDKVEVSQN